MPVRLLANGWSLGGAAPLVVGWAGKRRSSMRQRGCDESKNCDNRSYGGLFLTSPNRFHF